MRTISSWLAVAFGLLLAVLETARNWGHWEWWPFWVVDYLAAAMLVAGGWKALQRGVTQLLCAAWGFACAMFWMSFFGHLERGLKAGAAVGPDERFLTAIIGGLFVITVVGLFLTLLVNASARSHDGHCLS